MISKIINSENRIETLESDVLRNIKRSLRTLHEKEHNILEKESGHYIALGNVVETSKGRVELQDQRTYNTTISRIKKFNEWMFKAG